MLRPGDCSPFTDKGFYFRAFIPESPPRDVEYNYAGKQPIPAAGLSPAGHAALWAASEGDQMRITRNPKEHIQSDTQYLVEQVIAVIEDMLEWGPCLLSR